MKWKTREDGLVAAAPVEDWLVALHGSTLVFQLRFHTTDEQGSAVVLDQPFALPAELAGLLAAQMLECIRTGDPQSGNPGRATEQ